MCKFKVGDIVQLVYNYDSVEEGKGVELDWIDYLDKSVPYYTVRDVSEVHDILLNGNDYYFNVNQFELYRGLPECPFCGSTVELYKEYDEATRSTISCESPWEVCKFELTSTSEEVLRVAYLNVVRAYKK